MSNRFIPDPTVDTDTPSFSSQSLYNRYVSSLSQNLNQNLNRNQNPLNEVRFTSQIQNPNNENQTLEQAFSRLAVTNQSSFAGYGGGVVPSVVVDDSPYYNYGFQACETTTAFNRSVRNVVNAAGGELISSPSSQNHLLMNGGYGFNDYDYALLARQNAFGCYGNVNGDGSSFFNGGVGVGNGDELLRKIQCGLGNESSVQNAAAWVDDVVNVNNVNVNVNGTNRHWFDDFSGRVYMMAKDHHGSKILQELIDNFKGEAVSRIFLELINHITELMPDPAGSQVIQKMVGFCNQDQQNRIVLVITHHSVQLIKICLNLHGSRAVEKLLEKITTIGTRQQRTLIMSALTPSAILLSKDINGHRVVLHCLKNFPPEETKQFLYVLARNTLSIARDKTGCCVLQYCATHTQGEAKNHLIDDIVLNASLLAEDCYGNYVIQHLLSLKIPRVSTNLLRQLEGQFIYLACNKYGSNVVEKFFHDSGVNLSAYIICELLRDPNVSRLLVDPYGNYVISSALTRFKGSHAIKNALLELIRNNSQMMRTNMYGKKLLDKFEGRNPYL